MIDYINKNLYNRGVTKSNDFGALGRDSDFVFGVYFVIAIYVFEILEITHNGGLFNEDDYSWFGCSWYVCCGKSTKK